MAAVKALTTGSKWQWNPAANPKEKQIRKKKTEKPSSHKTAHKKDQKSKDAQTGQR